VKCNQVRSAQWTVQNKKIKNNTPQEHIYKYNKKRREIKNKMCKTVYWDLINSNNKF